jgi:hypothetical protein
MEPIIMTTEKSGLPYFLLFHGEGGFGNGAETFLVNVLHKNKQFLFYIHLYNSVEPKQAEIITRT